MDLRDMEAVVTIAELGSFSAAAHELFVAQPSLSKRIKALEAELGARLFDRSVAGVRLTDAGAAFVGPARAALGLADGARDAVADVAGLRGGTVRLTALPTIVVTHLVPLMSRFRAAHDAVTVQVWGAANHRHAVAMVQDGRADLALCDRPVVASGLVVEHAFDQEMVAVLPPGTRVRRGRVGIASLAHHPVVVTEPGTSTRELVDELYGAAGLVPRVVVETDLRDALVPSVLAGAGMTFVSEALARAAVAQGAVMARIAEPPVRQVSSVRRPGASSPALAAFVDLASRTRWQA